mmetsp:Transcript_71562/g.221308  ORF Transcript_71562/g.221308 Transcript_71562/m.221308 type:complete len:296 (-) Transcript_71562:570-1457(-)
MVGSLAEIVRVDCSVHVGVSGHELQESLEALQAAHAATSAAGGDRVPRFRGFLGEEDHDVSGKAEGRQDEGAVREGAQVVAYADHVALERRAERRRVGVAVAARAGREEPKLCRVGYHKLGEGAANLQEPQAHDCVECNEGVVLRIELEPERLAHDILLRHELHARRQVQEAGSQRHHESGLQEHFDARLEQQGARFPDALGGILDACERRTGAPSLAASQAREGEAERAEANADEEVPSAISRARQVVRTEVLRRAYQVDTQAPGRQDHCGQAGPHDASGALLQNEEVHEPQHH